MPKTHFLVSESPQKFDHSISALCGATLRNPEPVMMVELSERSMAFSRNDCPKCIKELAASLAAGKQYIYALIEAQEAMHSGDTLEKIEQAVSRHSKFTQGIDSAPDGKSERAATETR